MSTHVACSCNKTRKCRGTYDTDYPKPSQSKSAYFISTYTNQQMELWCWSDPFSDLLATSPMRKEQVSTCLNTIPPQQKWPTYTHWYRQEAEEVVPLPARSNLMNMWRTYSTKSANLPHISKAARFAEQDLLQRSVEFWWILWMLVELGRTRMSPDGWL